MREEGRFPQQWIAALRSECAQNYKDEHFLRQTGFRIARKAPEA
jgi:hypothetical protein